MTMPCERTRALRWAGKFLEKLNGVELPKNIKREISHFGTVAQHKRQKFTLFLHERCIDHKS